MRVVTVLVPLPMFYNPDEAGHRRPIEDEKFTLTAEEVAQRFGGGTLWMFPEGVAPRGYWWNRGILNTDILAMLEVDVSDTRENRNWLQRYAAEVLIERFEQDVIYLKFYGGDAASETTTVSKRSSR